MFVTHDPHIALLSDFRLIMEEGTIKKVIFTAKEEKKCNERVARIDNALAFLRDQLRKGHLINSKDFEERL